MPDIIERLSECLKFWECRRLDEGSPAESESEKAIRAAILEIKKLRSAMSGWDAYGWKDGEYIDALDEYFDEIINS